MGRDTIQLEGAVSTIFEEYLLEFTSEYGIPEALHPELPGPEETIVDFPEGKVGLYTKLFEFADYRIPLSHFLFDIKGYYQIHLSQLSVIEMDLFNLISAPNPTKVKTSTRPRDAHEVPLLTVIAARVIDMEDVTIASGSSGTQSTMEKSSLDFANENPSPLITEGDGTKNQVRDAFSSETLVAEHPSATEVIPEPDLEEEAAAIGPIVNKRRRKRGATFSTPTTRDTPTVSKSVSDPKPLSSSKKVVGAKDPDFEKSTSFTSMSGSPGGIYQPGWSVTNSCHLDTPGVCQEIVDHIVPPGYFSELRHLPNDEFLDQYNVNLARQVVARRDQRIEAREEEISKLDQEVHGLRDQAKNLETLLEAEADMKKTAEAKNAQVTGEERIKAAFEEIKKYEDDRVNARCAKIDARLDALSIYFNEELYPHMLTVIAGRQWVIGHGLRLAVMKCSELMKLRQAFTDVVYAGIVKGMSEWLKHGVEHSKAQLDLAAIEAYDPEADAKYVAALHALKKLKYPLVGQLEKLKDAPMELIMASLHLESDSREDAPQWIRDLRPSTSQLKIHVYLEVCNPRNPYCGQRKPCREEEEVSSDITKDEASSMLLSKSLPPLYNLDWP
ncbi:hypothetical protein Tco_1000355 [Tanacetum coccineum]